MTTIIINTDKGLDEAINKYGKNITIDDRRPNKDNNPELARIKYEYGDDNPETITGQ